MAYILLLDETIQFDAADRDAGIFTFHSDTINPYPNGGADVDNTSINLMSAEGDHLLHVSIRRTENAIIFNSKSTDGSWGQEESVRLFGVFVQTDATIVVDDRVDHYQILADGDPVYDFTKRIQKQVTSAAYRSDSIVPFFSNALNVAAQPRIPADSYEKAYFPLTAEAIAEQSEQEPFDMVIIGSGIGGGVLITDLLAKNQRLTASQSSFGAGPMTRIVARYNRSAAGMDDHVSLRILVIERGGLKFNTHSLNMPRPTSRGTYGQMNDMFYNHFKERWDMDDATRKIWKGGPVFCLGGRSTVWGLFSPRVSDDTFRSHFPPEVYRDLNDKYLRKAEETMNLSYPETLPLHRALMDKLNTRDRRSLLPTTQWEWGRVASEFRNARNFDFAEGAYSTVDRLLEAAMDDPRGRGKFKTIINAPVARLEPKPEAGLIQPLTHVVVSDGTTEHKIRCNKAVVCAGTVESAAILVRSAGEDTLAQAYGPNFVRDFGHVTDHYIFYVTLPFFYRDMASRDKLGGMKLQTDITFQTIDNTTALANISIDASSFLPRRNVPDSEFPQFIIAYILPSALSAENKVEINGDGQPRIKCGYAREPDLEEKKEVLVDFAVDVMNKVAAILDIQFVHHPAPECDYTPIPIIRKEDLTLGELGPGGVAHELGSIPMPDKTGQYGVVDKDLKMQYGWDNVYVCDLSVFPYSPAANPTLSLAALALRLSDTLVQPTVTQYQPIIVYNLTLSSVWVTMSLSKTDGQSFGPVGRVEIASGKSQAWKRQEKETIYVYACACAENFSVQIVQPGVNAMIVATPPAAPACTCP